MTDPAKRLIILRGVSGAGKTTYWRTHYPDARVCTTEDYFTRDANGGLSVDQFRPASACCYRDAIEAAQEGSPLIVVDNTSSSMAEVAPCMMLAEAYGYEWEIITICAPMRDAWERNVHGTPWQSQQRTQRRLEMFHRAIPVWWKFQGTIRNVQPKYTAKQLADAEAWVPPAPRKSIDEEVEAELLAMAGDSAAFGGCWCGTAYCPGCPIDSKEEREEAERRVTARRAAR